MQHVAVTARILQRHGDRSRQYAADGARDVSVQRRSAAVEQLQYRIGSAGDRHERNERTKQRRRASERHHQLLLQLHRPSHQHCRSAAVHAQHQLDNLHRLRCYYRADDGSGLLRVTAIARNFLYVLQQRCASRQRLSTRSINAVDFLWRVRYRNSILNIRSCVPCRDAVRDAIRFLAITNGRRLVQRISDSDEPGNRTDVLYGDQLRAADEHERLYADHVVRSRQLRRLLECRCDSSVGLDDSQYNDVHRDCEHRDSDNRCERQ